MKTVPLGHQGLTAPALVSGVMRIAEKTDEQVRELYAASREVGIDFFDHADIYGTQTHQCEQRFAQALKLSGAEREEITLQTKAGIVTDGPYFDFSYEHLVASVDGSLQALETDYIDVLLLHRPDALCEPEEVARAFSDLESAGKVRAFGVSNHTPSQIELLKTAVTQPLVANQIQLSLTHAPSIAQGVAANMAGLDQSTSRDNGVVDYCRQHGITIQAWSPFQAGDGKGVFLGSDDYPELNAVLDRLASRYGVTPLGIATAWLTRHPGEFQVVLGTTSPERVREAAAAAEIQLTRPEWYELLRTAGYLVP